MLVSVMAPHCENNGNTTTAILLALALGGMKKKVLLTHTDNISNSFYTYLGLHQFEDKTSTPTQMVKLLREGAIQSDAIQDYCKNVSENVFVFTNNKSNFTDEDMETFSRFLVENSDFEYLIYDFNNFESETAKYILRNSDVIVVNLTQSKIELDNFNKEIKRYQKMFEGKKVMLVVNNWEQIIGKDVAVTKELKIAGRPSIIHHNPYITKMSNEGKLLDLYAYVKRKDSRLVELSGDVNKLASNLMRIKISNMKARQEEHRKTLLQAGGVEDAQ